MKISEYINKLEAIKADHGDLEVEKYNLNWDRVPAPDPILAFRLVLSGRDRKPKFWHKGSSNPSAVGDSVVKI